MHVRRNREQPRRERNAKNIFLNIVNVLLFQPYFCLQQRPSFQSSKYAPFHRSSSQEMAVSSRPPNNLTRQKCFSRLPFQINKVNFILETRPLRTFLDRPVQRKRRGSAFCEPSRQCVSACICPYVYLFVRMRI